MKKHSIIFLLLLASLNSFACLETYQFKVFPVGFSEGKIYSVDVQIRRTNLRAGQWSNARIEKGDEFKVMWIMRTHLSVYDQNQKLISSTPVDTIVSLKSHYGDTLQKYYQKGVQLIIGKNAEMGLFTPEYISFCDFQQKCEVVSFNPSENRNYLSYTNRKFKLPILTDTTFYGFNLKDKTDNDLSTYNVSSVRIYKCKSMQLLIVDITTGHMPVSGDGSAYERKEYTPEFPFNDLNKAAYEEPLMHHGYGFDVFVVI